MQHLPRALAALGSFDQFILCEIVIRNGKEVKLPLDHRTMRAGNAHDPATWLSFEEASKRLNDNLRLGFVFTDNDPFFFLDIDDCFVDGALSEVADYLVRAFPKAAVEKSQSGQGLHIIGQYKQIPPHASKNTRNHIELYHTERFVMLTGNEAQGDASAKCDDVLAFIIQHYFPKTKHDLVDDWTDRAHEDWDGPDDDDVLVAKAMSTSSMAATFGIKASFKDLFEANVDVLSQAFPSASGDDYDRSSADASLAQHLAFWTGNNLPRMKRIMYKSALVREKWDQRENYYIPRTIENAASRQTKFYNRNRRAPSTQQSASSVQGKAPSKSEATRTVGTQLMSVEEQLSYFEGCAYVNDAHRVFLPNGMFVKPEQFKTRFGGYLFMMDSTGTKTTKNAFEVFTESQAVRFPKVDAHSFQPKRNPGEIFQLEGKTYVNTYVPIETEQTVGDPSPFLNLVEKILPDETDRNILISYMAGVLQYPGVKFQFCPVLQGVEGNGKTTFVRILERGVGMRYTHMPNSSELAKNGGKFTGWLDRKLFIGVEEIHIPNKPGGLLDIMKPLISNNRVESQSKGVDQVMGDNVSNWFMCCNRKDDVPVTADTRRYAIFYSAQQEVGDLTRDGMVGNFWKDLYAWLEADGYAIMNNYLRNYKIPDEYNPSILSRAPKTSSTGQAIEATRTEIEEEILNAIEEERPGFRNGWVSSVKVWELLQEKRLKLRHNRLRDTMKSLGYDWHPLLRSKSGRLPSRIMSENYKRPTVFVPPDHMSYNYTDITKLHKAYEKAQGYSDVPGKGDSSNATSQV